MINIDKELIEKVAANARLSLSDEEKERFVKEFQQILDAFSVVEDAPASDVASVHPQPVLDVARDDTPMPCLTQEEALANTQHKKDGYFKGPRAV